MLVPLAATAGRSSSSSGAGGGGVGGAGGGRGQVAEEEVFESERFIPLRGWDHGNLSQVGGWVGG